MARVGDGHDARPDPVVDDPGIEERIGIERRASFERRPDGSRHEPARHHLGVLPHALARETRRSPAELRERGVPVARQAKADVFALGTQGNGLRRHDAESGCVERDQPPGGGRCSAHPVDVHERIDVGERSLSPVERVVLDAAHGEQEASARLLRVDRPERTVVRDARRAVAARDTLPIDRQDHDRVREDAIHNNVPLGPQDGSWSEPDGLLRAREDCAVIDRDGEKPVVVVFDHVEHALLAIRDRTDGANAAHGNRPHLPQRAVAQRVARDVAAELATHEDLTLRAHGEARRGGGGLVALDLAELLIEQHDHGAAPEKADQEERAR